MTKRRFRVLFGGKTVGGTTGTAPLETRDDALDSACVLIRDPDGAVRFWSEGAERLYGFSNDEAVGRVSHDLLRTEFPQPLAEIDAALLRDGVWNGHLRHRTRDGFPVEVASHWTLGRSARDEPVAVVEVDNHISGQMAAEGAVRRVAEEIRQTRGKAEQSTLSKTDFLAAVCRDLSQFVQSMVLSSAALVPHVGSAKGHEALAMLDCGLDTFRNLLDTWRLAVGEIKPKVTTVPIRPLLNRIGSSHAVVAAAQEVHFEIAPTCNVMVRSDLGLLSRILGSLIENAVHFTPAGQVRVDCVIQGGHLQVAIHDTGIGIPDEHIDRIWEAFHQVGNPPRGLGLGLTVVRRLSRLLDHPVEVRSVPGVGSVFTLSLPLETAQIFHLPGSTAHGGALRRSNRRCAVLVDDNALVLLALSATFENWGYDVLTAESADQAVERLEGFGRSPDIVVVDYHLRDGHLGTEALLRIREQVGAPVPGIILTSDKGPDCHRDAARHGLGIAVKPISPSALQAAVERQMALGKRALPPGDVASGQGRAEGQG